MSFLQWMRKRAEACSSAAMPKRVMLTTAALVLLLSTAEITAQVPITNDPPQFGPYNGVFFPDGGGLRFPIANTHDTLLLADSPWSIYCWVNSDLGVEKLSTN